MPGKPSHFELGVPDTDRAQEFFGELLGWSFERTGKGARIATSGIPGGLHPEDRASIQVFFTVEDLDEAARRVVELGGQVGPGSEEGPDGRWLYACWDDQGVPFGLHEPARK
jgi:uncharacterized protein